MTVNYLLMDNRIRLEKQNKTNDQVTELILDNCRASQVSGLSEEFISLEALSIINVGLVTLKGFPKLPNLRKLELCDNRLSDGLNFLFGCQKLQELNISGNNFKDMSSLEPLRYFKYLTNLDLYNCEITRFSDYRQKVFDLLPNLQLLDGFSRPQKEVISPQSPEQTNPVTEPAAEGVEQANVCLTKDVSMVIENVNKEETSPVNQDAPMVEDTVINDQTCLVATTGESSMPVENVDQETSPPAKEDTQMAVDSADEDAGQQERDENQMVTANSTNEATTSPEKQNLDLDSTSGDSEKNISSPRATDEPEDNNCTVNVDVTRIDSENKDSVHDESLEIVENDDKDATVADQGASPIVEENDQQDSIIEISADHDTSNEEDVADSSENQQEMSNEEEEEEESRSGSSSYEYLEEGELEEGECIDEEEEDEEELDESGINHNRTYEKEYSSEEEEDSDSNSDEVQNDTQQDDNSQVLQELSGMKAAGTHEESGQVQEHEQKEREEEQQSGDVEKL